MGISEIIVLALIAAGGNYIRQIITSNDKQDVNDLLKSIFVIGQVGTGKTTFLINLVHKLKKFGSVFFITFKDEKTNIELLNTFNDKEKDDVIYIDPTYSNYKIGFPIYGDKRDSISNDKYVDNILDIYKAIWPEAIYANSEDILSNIYAGVAEMSVRTPLEAYMCMNLDFNYMNGPFAAYRRKVINRCTNPIIKNFFEYQLPKRLKDETKIAPPQNKQNRLTDKRAIQYILCQERPKLKLEKRMKKGKVTVFNYSQENLGTNQASFLSAFTLGMLKQESFQRKDKKEPVFIFCDEFPQYTTKTFNDVIDMGRGLGTSFVLACQYLTQVSRDIQASIDGSIGNKYYFRTGKHDAELLSRFLGIETNELKDLEDYYYYKEILNHGERAEIIKEKAPRPRKQYNNAEYIKENSIKQYGVNVKDIENSICRRLGIEINSTIQVDFIKKARNNEGVI